MAILKPRAQESFLGMSMIEVDCMFCSPQAKNGVMNTELSTYEGQPRNDTSFNQNNDIMVSTAHAGMPESLLILP